VNGLSTFSNAFSPLWRGVKRDCAPVARAKKSRRAPRPRGRPPALTHCVPRPAPARPPIAPPAKAPPPPRGPPAPPLAPKKTSPSETAANPLPAPDTPVRGAPTLSDNTSPGAAHAGEAATSRPPTSAASSATLQRILNIGPPLPARLSTAPSFTHERAPRPE